MTDRHCCEHPGERGCALNGEALMGAHDGVEGDQDYGRTGEGHFGGLRLYLVIMSHSLHLHWLLPNW